MDLIYSLLNFYFILQTIEAVCTNKNDVHLFGDQCGFMCHCKQNATCDVTTGECPSGCDNGWYGPGCQYRDIADGQYSKLSDNTSGWRANDGNPSTCCKQEHSENTKYLFWSINLSAYETINEIQIVTTPESLVSFKNFKVVVENITSTEKRKAKKQICFKQKSDAPETTKFTVLCDSPVIGNSLRIELTKSQTLLEVCDVKINGGRNVAFMRPASQVSKIKQQCGDRFCKAEYSVDGRTKLDTEWYCSYTDEGEDPWWQVDIGYKTRIWGVQILSYEKRARKQLPYLIHLSNVTDIREGGHKYTTSKTSNDTQSIAVNDIGRFVKIIEQGKNIRLTICEVFIFGDCPGNKCGYNCEKSCDCKHNTVCNKITGRYTNNCERKNKGYLCNASGKADGDDDDHFKCSENCLEDKCNPKSRVCTKGCIPGWRGKYCNQSCVQGEYGQNCSSHCNSNCLHGNKHCDKVNGHCLHGCKEGWKEPLCNQECDAGTFGKDCKSNCSSNCNRGTCERVNGKCFGGCKPGYMGNKCSENCTPGTFGEKCEEKCSNHCYGGYTMCRNVDGHCLNGCNAGWNGKRCDSACEQGKFGEGCKETCPSNCKHGGCDYRDGTCTDGCMPGFQGSVCEEECDAGFYGENCASMCGRCKSGTICNHVTGTCYGGCETGYTGYICLQECDAGFYGENCTSVCGRCKSGTACNHVTGTCYGGCETGYTGDICLQATQVSNSSNMAAVGAVVAALVIIVLIGVLVVFYKRRNKNKRNDEHMGNIELTQPSTSADNESRRLSNGDNNIHVNPDESSSTSADETNIYKNYPMPEQTRNRILLQNLLSYVKQNLANPQLFLNEFKGIPFGMQYSSAVANKSYNRGKNRYKDMRAYDKTRVVLKTLSNELGSDYINASFIKGHHKEKAYIAAQGPIETSVDDFWRMIWEKDVYTIAMVTNIVEEEKMKCLQYWPPVETRIRYGSTLVNTVSEVIYADFTIRNLKVSSEKEKSERNIRQFHFTSWPDKSVPLSTSSLLQFWSKVRKNDATKEHTWLVHCSAGVGRTGTFIATDILYDQGKDKGYIDVCQCVTNLRDQRVNMVQAKDQYVYLHTLMVEALLRPSQPVTLDNLHKVVRDLKTVDPATRKTGLLLQYEALKEDMAPLYTRIAGETENMYSTAMLEENRNKNRFSSILPPNRYRTFLVSNIPGCTNYINAVHMPSYSHKQGYIVTQKPLENTVIDYYRLIYEQNVKVIVMFPDKDCMQDCAEASMSVGPFTLTKVSEEDKSFYTKRIFNMMYHKEQSKIIQLEFQNWKERQIIPRDHDEMLSFVQEVELLNRVEGDNPVLVQCLDGSEKSGLFVCLVNILEHVRLDNEVSIPQVIRQLRHIRQQIIPNFEQFQFCYDVLLSYIDSKQMYANM